MKKIASFFRGLPKTLQWACLIWVVALLVLAGTSLWSKEARDAGRLRLQAANAAEFKRVMYGARLVRRLELEPGQPHGLRITCANAWRSQSRERQQVIKQLWFSTWDEICAQSPVRSSAEARLTVVEPDGKVSDVLRPI